MVVCPKQKQHIPKNTSIPLGVQFMTVIKMSGTHQGKVLQELNL